MAEGGGLLNRYTVKSRIGGSNPPLTANSHIQPAFTPCLFPSPTHASLNDWIARETVRLSGDAPDLFNEAVEWPGFGEATAGRTF